MTDTTPPVAAKRGRKPGPTAPVPTSKRVEESRSRAIAAGAARMPNGMLTPEAVQALKKLQAFKYAGGRVACINKALIAAAALI